MQIILFIAIIILKCIFSALSFFSLMKKREMPHKYVAFVPILNSTFALGNLSDSINKNYFRKTFNRFFLLISWLMSAVFGSVSVILIKSYIPNLYEKLLESILKPNSNLDITHVNFSFPSYHIRLTILVCLFLFVLSLIVSFVLNFSCFYTIYKEYNKSYSTIYIFLAIFCSSFLGLKFVPSVLVFIISKNTPVFEFLNKVKTNKY